MKILPSLYKDYGQYLNSFRAFPNINDGLRPGERRILYSANLVAKKFVKSAKIIGTAVVFHPHGDSSIYSTMTKLVNCGLLNGQGNWGDSSSLEELPPAAFRYTEARIDPFYSNLVFSNIQYVPWVINELEKEPEYLSTPIPLCFVLDKVNIGIGLGWRTSIPKYKVSDIFKLIDGMLNNKKIIIHPYCPGNEIIKDKNFETECENILTKGEGKITFRPKINIDKNQRIISIKSVPLNGFNQLLSGLNSYFDKNTISILDNTTNGKTSIDISVIKNKKCDFNKLVKDVYKCVTHSVTYKIILCDSEGNLFPMGVIEAIKNVYQNYKKSLTKKYTEEIAEYQKQKRKLEIIKLIRNDIGYLLSNKIYDIDKVIEYIISKHNELSKESLYDIFSKYTLNKLFNLDTNLDKIISEINIRDQYLNNMHNHLKNIYKEMWEKSKAIKE